MGRPKDIILCSLDSFPRKKFDNLNNFIALTESAEVGCQKPDNPAMSPMPLIRQAPVTLIHSGKQRVGKGGNKNC